MPRRRARCAFSSSTTAARRCRRCPSRRRSSAPEPRSRPARWVACRPHPPGEIADALVGRSLVTVHLWLKTSNGGPCSDCTWGGPARQAPPRAGPPRAAAGRTWPRRRRGLAQRVRGTGGTWRRADQGAHPRPGGHRRRRQLAGGRSPVARPPSPPSPRRLAGPRRAGAPLARLRAALRSAMRRGGAHTGDVIAARRVGASCPRCGAPMERATVGGRTTFWCSEEQRVSP